MYIALSCGGGRQAMTTFRRRNVLALVVAVAVAAEFTSARAQRSTVPPDLDPELHDGLLYAPPPNLPKCTPTQLKMREKSSNCFKRFMRVNETGGECPSDCCCIRQISQVNSSLTVGTLGSCFVRGIKDRNGTVLSLVMLPFSPVRTGSPDMCTKTTPDLCADLVGRGCAYGPGAGQNATAPAKTSSSAQPRESTEEEEDGGGGTNRNVIALSVTLSVLGVLLLVASLWFIVLPWLRGSTRSSGIASEDEEDIDAEVDLPEGPDFVSEETRDHAPIPAARTD